jgi:hypothetical protein
MLEAFGVMAERWANAVPRQRIATAGRYLKDFFDCDRMRLRPPAPETIPKLLAIHAEVAGIA